ncbi:S8 family peptidase [Rubrobacter aplysinae]|uniref:S8 family peptidase n=1 Tax=Rubrobacter aplysinae TaxID=909625 RepID=UPI00069FFE28|nr:S8 family serine peptidase [Rubrobacter aplysinae]
MVLLASMVFAASVVVVGVIHPAWGASKNGGGPDASQDTAKPEPAPGNDNAERETVKGPDGKPVQAGSLLVSYEAGVSRARQNANARGIGGEVSERVKTANLAILKLPERANLGKAKKGLEKRPGVESVEYDYKVKAANTNVNDYFYRQGKQYELSGHLRFSRAWDRARGYDRARGHPVHAAVLDSGCNKVRDLKRQIIRDYDFFNGDPYAYDDSGHGTRVASILGARTNDRGGMASGAWRTKILCGKVSNQNDFAYYSTLVRGMKWARNKNARVVNMSFESYNYSKALCDTAKSLYRSGTLVVAAAGNSGGYERAVYPAACPGALGVSAVNIYDKRTSFSSYGPYVDLAATGRNVMTLRRNGTYRYANGTSFASPLVASAAALSMGKFDFNAKQVSYRLRSRARDIGPQGRDNYYGHGVVNAATAVQPY